MLDKLYAATSFIGATTSSESAETVLFRRRGDPSPACEAASLDYDAIWNAAFTISACSRSLSRSSSRSVSKTIVSFSVRWHS